MLLNIVYGHLTDGITGDALRDFDRTLGADPTLVAKVGAPSKGTEGLMAAFGMKGKS